MSNKPVNVLVTATTLLVVLCLGPEKLAASATTLPERPIAEAPVRGGVVAEQGQEMFIGDNLWSSTGPSVEDIRQSHIGNCYFDSAMAAVAYAEPGFIAKSISYNLKTGDFTVRLYDYPEGRDYIPGTHGDGNPWPANSLITPKTITVTQQDLKDDIEAGGVSVLDDGAPGYIWPAVMEAAYAKLLRVDYPDSPDATGAANQVEAGLRISQAGNPENPSLSGGDVDQGMAAVTGHTGVYVPAAISSYPAIAGAIANHQPVTMGTSVSQERDKDQLVFNHQYTVLGIAKDPAGNIKLTVRNPWATNDGIPGVEHPETGVITLDLQQELDDKVIGSFDIGPKLPA